MDKEYANSTLIIFVKNPEKGKVKTRLAKTIGAEKALEVYQKLLQITKSIVDPLSVHKQVWYSRFVDEDDLWSEGGYEKHPQEGENLGKRMQHAFEQAFTGGHQKVVIIGSDCSSLETDILREAFDQLDDHDVVIGPANDGGYYLLGMSEFYPSLFEGKTWSTSSVFESTIRQVENLNISYHLLPTLNDIDTEADLRASTKIFFVMSEISVVIPTYNEAGTIGETIRKVKHRSCEQITEIIVVDGGSADGTMEEAEKAGAIVLESPRKGRAAQMNVGAEQANGHLLYFLHADTHPPPNFDAIILSSFANGSKAGCFRLRFDSDNPLLKCYAWFTRFDINLFRFGDQSLFVEQDVFHQLEGFREDHIVMEDQEFVKRVKKRYSFDILDEAVVTSAEKYRKNGVIKLQLVFTLILCSYYLGASQDHLVQIYKRFID
jgi:rSAM/selenodomain-associated transferase 2/rSAM/selenodomain-associated transferase 1